VSTDDDIPCVYASLPAAVIAFGQAQGLERPVLLQAAGLTEADLEDPDELVPYDSLIGVWTLFGARFPGRPMGLEYAAILPMAVFGALGYAVRHAPTARAAVQAYLRFYRLVDPFLRVELHERGGRVRFVFGHEPRVFALAEPLEMIVGLTVRHARDMLGRHFNATQVAFPHPQRHPEAVYAAFFETEVVFEAGWTGVEFEAGLLDLPIPDADPGLGRYLVAHLEERLATRARPNPKLADRVSAEIEARLAQGEVAQADVAKALAMSPRTLQRRLDAEGASFSALLEGVRQRRAQDLLADGALSVQEVAYLLGYSEPRAFHRSFRRWTGTSAGAWRRGAR
jgi:AraC-like DNA-binding protein